MNKYISKICLVWLCALALSATAQDKLIDKDSTLVDLGFGIHKKLANSSAAVSIITSEELSQSSAINLADALYGRLLGLTALKSGGFAGDDNYGATFNIRGNQTLSENEILILVDGIKRPIDRLSVEEVESVTVLKDAAAVALLGYQGVNGALLVTTKRGTAGKIKVVASYDHKVTFSPELPDFVNAESYALAKNEARINDGLSPVYSDLEIELFKLGSDPLYYPNISWKDEVLEDMGAEDQLNLAMYGGNDKVKFYTMLDYTGSKGMLKNADYGDFDAQLKYSKTNIRSNLDFFISPTTTMSVNMLTNFIETNEPASGSANDIMYQVYRLPASAFPIKTPDGIWGGNEVYYDANPVARIQNTGREKTHQRALYADAKLTQGLDFWLSGLTASLRVGYDNYSKINEEHYNSFQYGYVSYAEDIGDKSNINKIVYGDKINNINYNKWQGNQWRTAHFEAALNYDKEIKEHSISSSVIYNSKSEVGMNRYNSFYRANVMGYFHYDWNKKIIADLVLAANGSNRSYPEKWAFSPTLSMAYVFANNKENKFLNFGKVRGSYGIQHSDYVLIDGIWLENYDGSHGNIVFKPSYHDNNWGSYLTHYPLTSFSLETANKANIGLDARLFNSLDITADAFYNRRSNIMLNANDLNSWVVGRPDSYATTGKVDSYGFEIGLNYIKRFSDDFVLRSTANFTWGTNEIKDYIELPAEEYQSRIGQRVDQAYGLEAIGFFADEDDISNSPEQHFSEVKPGDIKYKDQNGDNVIDENDAIYFGYGQNIPETNYSFSLGAEYKRIGFNILFQGVSGMTKYLGVTGVWDCLKNNNNLSEHYLTNAWRTGADNANALYPRLTTQENPNNYRANSVWYSNINWLKLRNIELYYRLPASFLDKSFIADAKLYVRGENLLTFSNIEVMDPEVLSTNYPVMKGVTAGMTIKF